MRLNDASVDFDDLKTGSIELLIDGANNEQEYDTNINHHDLVNVELPTNKMPAKLPFIDGRNGSALLDSSSNIHLFMPNEDVQSRTRLKKSNSPHQLQFDDKNGPDQQSQKDQVQVKE